MLSIGAIQLDVPFIQAALAGYTDLAMRRLARRYGAAFTFDGLLLDKIVLQRSRRRHSTPQLTEDDHPVGGQLAGADPGDMASAAVAMARAGYDVIDINFACPVRKVLGRGRGGFLMSQPVTALDIIRHVYDAVGSIRPVTVKMRSGMDATPQSKRDFFTILDGAFAIGVSAITVHGRTVVQRYVGPSDWSFLAKVKRHVGDRVILGSGDLFTAEACIRMIHETGVDGVAIARGCIGNPWVFQECRTLWTGGELPPPPSIERQREAIAGQWKDAVEVYGDRQAARIMRKFGVKYSEHHPLTTRVRDAFVAIKTAADFEEVLRIWYDLTADWPPVKRRTDPGRLIAAGARS